MRCPKCGKAESDITLSYCTECGTVLKEELTVVAKFNPETQTHPSIQPVIMSKGINPLFAILPTAFLLILIGGATVYWLKTDTPAANKNGLGQKTTESINNIPPITKQSTIADSPELDSNKNKNSTIKQFRVKEDVAIKGDNFLSLRRDPAIKSNNEIVRMPIGSIVEVDTSKTVRPNTIEWLYLTKYYDIGTGRQFSGWASSRHLQELSPN